MWSETLPYRPYREQYLPSFFPGAAKFLNLRREDRLLDLACGTGTLAFGFAPYVGSLTGVDMEQPMLDAARVEALRTGVQINLICATVEELPGDIGKFDLVTIGKAHWYLPRMETRSKLEQLVAPGGKVLLCVTTTDDLRSGQWAPRYRRLRSRLGRPRLTTREFMADSVFKYVATVRSSAQRIVSVDELLMRALAFPGSTPEQLGPEKDRYLAGIRDAVTPFAVNGKLNETLVTYGDVFARQ